MKTLIFNKQIFVESKSFEEFKDTLPNYLTDRQIERLLKLWACFKSNI